MKIKGRQITLQLRLTILTAICIIAVAAILTFLSVNRADVIVSSIAVTPSIKADDTKEMTKNEKEKMEELEKGQTIIGVEATPLQSANILMSQFRSGSIYIMLAVIIAGSGVAFWMTGVALKPVKKLASLIQNINTNHLHTRIEGFSSKDEIGSLADSFNQMMEKLERAFTQQKQFSSNAAHELKTPLAAIRTNIEVLNLSENPDQKEYQETIEVIQRNTERLINLVDGLLRINDEKKMLICESIDTEQMLEEIIELLKYEIKKNDLKIQIDNKLPVLYGSASSFYTVLENLIENAIKYNKKEGIVQIVLKEEAGQTIIQVKDTGEGIKEEDLTHIFEPFYRTDPSRSRKAGGSGLGLALVQNIVEIWHGEILVESKHGEGTCFLVTIPEQRIPPR